MVSCSKDSPEIRQRFARDVCRNIHYAHRRIHTHMHAHTHTCIHTTTQGWKQNLLTVEPLIRVSNLNPILPRAENKLQE